MKSMNATLAAEIQRLTPTQKLELVQELWDGIASGSEELSVPHWHTKELDHRLDHEAEDKDGSWEDVRGDILKR